ncbi:AMPN Aminopeptidase, partial [Pseudoatta argentina]
ISAMEIDMRFLILLLNSGLLHFGAADVFFIKDWKHERLLKFDGNRLPDNIYPIHYTIHLQLRDINHNTSVFGKCVIHMKIISLTQNISLRADELRIKELSFKGLKTLYKNRELTFFPVVSTYYSKNNVWAFMFEKELLPGFYNLNLTFAYLEADNKGLFRTSFINDEGDSTRLVALDFLPIGVRRIFPCFDEPRFQTTFDIFIAYKYVNYTILSNTPTIGLESVRDTIETTRFNVTRRIPTYHVSAILLSHFTTVKSLYFKNLFVVQTLQESLRFDDNFVMKPLITEIQIPSEIESIFSMSYYMKAPSILRMLQLMLSNDIFQKGIKTYLSIDPSLDDMTTIDAVWTAIQRVYDTSGIRHEGLSIKQLMDAWTKQQHYPVVKVTQNNSLATILIENMNTNEKNWSIPYTMATNANEHSSDFSLLTLPFKVHFPLVGEELFLNHSGSNWIIINVQQIGYYRVNYDKTTLGQISEYLISDDINKIHVLNRAQIIDDAFYFFIKKETDLNVFLALTKYLQQETDFIAWYPMFKGLEYMSTFFHYQSSSMYLKFIACSEDFFIIRNYIEMIRSAKFYNETQKDYDQVYIFHFVVERHAKNDTMLDYILANLDEIKPRFLFEDIYRLNS